LEIIEARLPDGQGEQKGQTIQGTYCTIWEKNDKGEWRFVLDTGNQGLSNDQ
jgi:ketosteroid isomerase-like protein